MERFFVDERTGCMAVRDSINTDPEYQGLHSYTEGVVKYWSGVYEKAIPCSSCGHIEIGKDTQSDRV